MSSCMCLCNQIHRNLCTCACVGVLKWILLCRYYYCVQYFSTLLSVAVINISLFAPFCEYFDNVYLFFYHIIKDKLLEISSVDCNLS